MTIRRSLLGLIAIFIVGTVLEGFMVWIAGKIAAQPNSEPFVAALAMFVTVVILIVTLVSMYLYWAARLVLTDAGLQVVRYRTLFWSIQSSVSWADIEEVTVTEGGILRGLFGIGTLLVQTSSAEPNLALNYLGDIDALRDFVANKAGAAD